MRHRRLVLVLSIVALAPVGLTTAAGAAPTTAWTPPVAGRVVRPFDPPKSRFGAGHLGVDLAAPRGTPVRAAGPGVVAFAGSVAGALHVVVAHAGNLRTSYSFLATISVRRGERVERGAIVGTTGGVGQGHDGSVLHFALRSGDTYIDPTLLLRPIDLATVVHLAPTRVPVYPASRASERRGLIAGLAHTAGAVVHAVVHAGATAVAAVGRGAQRFVASQLPIPAAIARGVANWFEQRGHCDSHAPDADGTGGSDHRVMIVAGVDSSITDGGPSSPLPARALGYEASEVTYFSYARGGGDYTPADTEGPLLTAARRLGEQLRALERREPGREVDLIGHSQGGVVVEAFLELVYHPGDPSYPPLGTVVSLASPLYGDPGADAVAHIRETATGRAVLGAGDAVASRLGSPLPASDAASLRDLASDSAFMHALKARAIPPQVEFTALGAATDPLVPAGSATRPGAENATVLPHVLNAHSGIVSDASALRDVRAALEQRPLPCQSLVKTLSEEVVSTAISNREATLAAIGELAVGARP